MILRNFAVHNHLQYRCMHVIWFFLATGNQTNKAAQLLAICSS